MSGQYILRDDHTVEPCDDLHEWAVWLEHAPADRVVRQEWVGPHFVSTVFLGLDYQFGNGPPILFETKIFIDGGEAVYQDRCSTWDEALAMHAQAVAHISAKGERT